MHNRTGNCICLSAHLEGLKASVILRLMESAIGVLLVLATGSAAAAEAPMPFPLLPAAGWLVLACGNAATYVDHRHEYTVHHGVKHMHWT